MHLEKDKLFTLDEYEKLQYKYNIEFINGDVVLNSKTSVKHNEIDYITKLQIYQKYGVL